MTAAPTLNRRTLNRSLLARQMLLARVGMPVIDLVEHLVGVQAQEPSNPYITMWTRLNDFDPMELSRALEDKRVVRAPLMRSTIHLVSSGDVRKIRPLVQRVLERAFSGQAFGKRLTGLDIQDMLDAGRAILEEQPRTTPEIGKLLLKRWPGRDAEALGFAVKFALPLVQTPPRGLWGRTGRPYWTTVEGWLGKPLAKRPSIDQMFLRYLTAFGPATMADFRNWSGISGHRDLIDRLRAKLVTFCDEKERELFDVPGSPFPDADTPAPPRFFGDYDNVFLGHADRSRIIYEAWPVKEAVGWSSFSVDGFVCGTWKIERKKTTATLVLGPIRKLTNVERSALVEEGADLLRFLEEGRTHHVCFE